MLDFTEEDRKTMYSYRGGVTDSSEEVQKPEGIIDDVFVSVRLGVIKNESYSAPREMRGNRRSVRKWEARD